MKDRICPNRRICEYADCLGKNPHMENHECGLGHQPMIIFRNLPCKNSKPCIQIPEKYLDKGE